ncbi:MAG: flagellar protein [Candidatus Kapabacteria bacterium]|nr:flagellar protein [Candidatus Kapabacteria bacterium]
MSEIDGIRLPFVPAGGISELKRNNNAPKTTVNQGSFSDVFKQEISKLKFSGHAQTRMISRDISLNPDELIKLENAVQQAENKGSEQTLALMNDKAFIINIPNRTIITAVNQGQLESNIITDIDSVVFLNN